MKNCFPKNQSKKKKFQKKKKIKNNSIAASSNDGESNRNSHRNSFEQKSDVKLESPITLHNVKRMRIESKRQQIINNSIKEEENKIPEEILDDKMKKSRLCEIWKPLGFANPKGYCYLNSVVQVLGSCEDFKADIYKYKWVSDENTKDSIFVKGLFNLIKSIRESNKENLNESLKIVQTNITESSLGDDVYKCFMNLLTRVSNVIKTNTNKPQINNSNFPTKPSAKAEAAFIKFKSKNPGFVFDNFYGQLTFQTVCKICQCVCHESFQMIKSLPLPVIKSKSSVNLNSCIDLFFNDSDVEVDEPMKCNCKEPSKSLKSVTKLTHGPKYLFIYLNRGSYKRLQNKNNTHVTCEDLTIEIKTINEPINYKLISVIDHTGNSLFGHYYCKCSFESEEWWVLNDSRVEQLKKKNEIVTRNTIVFFFKSIKQFI